MATAYQGPPARPKAIVGGDARCVSIAAASIIANVTRDRMCAVMHARSRSSASATRLLAQAHLAALDRHGDRHHRWISRPAPPSPYAAPVAEGLTRGANRW